MPLVVEDGTGLANANCYVSNDYIDVYAEDRSWTDWTAASDEAKEAAMIEATTYLDTSYSWKGSISLLTQALAWPRLGVTDREGRTMTGVPARIKDACCELARLKLSGALVTARTEAEVQSLQAGSVSITYAQGSRVKEAERFAWVDRLLVGLQSGRAGGVNINLSKA